MRDCFSVLREGIRERGDILVEVIHGEFFIAEIRTRALSWFCSARLVGDRINFIAYSPVRVPLMDRRKVLELLTVVNSQSSLGHVEMGLSTGRIRHRLELRDGDLGRVPEIIHEALWVPEVALALVGLRFKRAGSFERIPSPRVADLDGALSKCA